jgi:hypothetical protein
MNYLSVGEQNNSKPSLSDGGFEAILHFNCQEAKITDDNRF